MTLLILVIIAIFLTAWAFIQDGRITIADRAATYNAICKHLELFHFEDYENGMKHKYSSVYFSSERIAYYNSLEQFLEAFPAYRDFSV